MRAVVRWLFVPPLLYGLMYLAYQMSEQPRERRHAVRIPAFADALLRLARVGPEDLIYDLECGDGTLVIAAAQQQGARSVCLDTFPRRIRDAEARAEGVGVRSLIQFNVQDWRNTDISSATVVVLFSPVQWHYSLRGQLTRQLRPGTRIVSYLRDLGGWEPAEVVVLAPSADERGVPLMLWIADGKYRPKGLGEVRPASIPDVWGTSSRALRTNTRSR